MNSLKDKVDAYKTANLLLLNTINSELEKLEKSLSYRRGASREQTKEDIANLKIIQTNITEILKINIL